MIKVRLKFSKNGPVRFIGHLDLMRYFQKVNRRAEIDVKYSEGFSPHQVMSFAEPLSVGATSDGEYLDMQLNNDCDMTELVNKLNSVMNEGVKIISAKKLPDDSPKAMTQVEAAEWIMSFRKGKEPEIDFENLFNKYIENDTLPAVKKTKKGESVIDMKPLIYKIEVAKKKDIKGFYDDSYRYKSTPVDDDKICVHALVSSGSSDHLKPAMIIDNFMKSIDMELAENAICLHRVDTYKKEGDKIVPM